MPLGRVSSAALLLSGAAALVAPDAVASALRLVPSDARGMAETRAGLGGTYAALGAWSCFSSSPEAAVAVGVTWWGAAAARLTSLVIDRPRTDGSFWTYLGLEVVLGGMAVTAARRARRRGLRPGTTTG